MVYHPRRRHQEAGDQYEALSSNTHSLGTACTDKFRQPIICFIHCVCVCVCVCVCCLFKSPMFWMDCGLGDRVDCNYIRLQQLPPLASSTATLPAHDLPIVCVTLGTIPVLHHNLDTERCVLSTRDTTYFHPPISSFPSSYSSYFLIFCACCEPPSLALCVPPSYLPQALPYH